MTAQANALPLLSDRLAVAYQPLWQPDRVLLGTSMALLLIGLVMIGSASIDVSEQTFGVPHHFVLRHAVYMVIGFGLAYLVSAVPLRLWQSFSWLLLVLAMVLLVLVLIPGIGREVKGSWRWIDLGPVISLSFGHTMPAMIESSCVHPLNNNQYLMFVFSI